MLQAGRPPVRVPDEVDFFFNLPNSSSRTLALGSTQPLTEMSTRNFPGGKKRPARRADKLAVMYEQNVCKMWEPLLPKLYIHLSDIFKICYTLTDLRRQTFIARLFALLVK
jgi:hypothetical protein